MESYTVLKYEKEYIKTKEEEFNRYNFNTLEEVTGYVSSDMNHSMKEIKPNKRYLVEIYDNKKNTSSTGTVVLSKPTYLVVFYGRQDTEYLKNLILEEYNQVRLDV